MTDPKVGKPCQFYHEGGHGERRWVIGWRYGIIRGVPTNGRHAGCLQIEIPVALWEQDFRTHTWRPLSPVKVWIDRESVNEVGDVTYHGPDLRVLVEERTEAKKEEQRAADHKRRKLSAQVFRRGD